MKLVLWLYSLEAGVCSWPKIICEVKDAKQSLGSRANKKYKSNFSLLVTLNLCYTCVKLNPNEIDKGFETGFKFDRILSSPSSSTS